MSPAMFDVDIIEQQRLVKARLARAHAYFRAHGEEPEVIAPDFWLYHIAQMKTDAEIFHIATGRRES